MKKITLIIFFVFSKHIEVKACSCSFQFKGMLVCNNPKEITETYQRLDIHDKINYLDCVLEYSVLLGRFNSDEPYRDKINITLFLCDRYCRETSESLKLEIYRVLEMGFTRGTDHRAALRLDLDDFFEQLMVEKEENIYIAAYELLLLFEEIIDVDYYKKRIYQKLKLSVYNLIEKDIASTSLENIGSQYREDKKLFIAYNFRHKDENLRFRTNTLIALNNRIALFMLGYYYDIHLSEINKIPIQYQKRCFPNDAK